MLRFGAILTLAALTALTSSCVSPTPEPTVPAPTESSAPTASSAPAEELTEDDVAAITAALNSGRAEVLTPYFTESVAYGSYATDGRAPITPAVAVEQLTSQIELFGPLVCPADPATLDPLRPLLAEANLDWLRADAITCTTSKYVFSFLPEGAKISGYFTIPMGAATQP